MTINEKMTALADGIRELSGSDTAKGLDDMTTDVNAANAEIAEQTELISQITTLVATKAQYNTLYITNSVPSNDKGVNGDICIVTEATI